MNNNFIEMTEKLKKYIQDDGLYNVPEIAKEDELAFAKAYNESMFNQDFFIKEPEQRIEGGLSSYFNEDKGIYELGRIMVVFDDYTYANPLKGTYSREMTSLLIFGTSEDFSKMSEEFQFANAYNTWKAEADKFSQEHSGEHLAQQILDNTIDQSVYHIRNRCTRMTTEELRKAVKILLAALERSKKVSNRESGAINNRVLFALEEMHINGTPLGIGHGDHEFQNTWTDISNAQSFADGDNLKDEPILFTRETEEFLASLGL